MILSRFNKLSLREKTQWIYFKGEFVTSIRYYGYKINLYLIEDVYIELFYHHTKDCIEKIEPLEMDSTRMNFYADQISLPVDLV